MKAGSEGEDLRIMIAGSEKFAELLRISQDHDEPCILCGRPTRGRGIFSPDTPELYGPRPKEGKQRCIMYPRCEGHERQQVNHIIELMIQEAARRDGVAPVLDVGQNPGAEGMKTDIILELGRMTGKTVNDVLAGIGQHDADANGEGKALGMETFDALVGAELSYPENTPADIAQHLLGGGFGGYLS